MIHKINICRYFCFNDKEEGKLLIETLNKKIKDLVECISELEILPVNIEVVLHPHIYELPNGEGKNDKRYKYAGVAELIMDYCVINKTFDKQQEVEATRSIVERLQSLQTHKVLGPALATIHGTNINELYGTVESISTTAKTSYDARLSIRDKVFGPIKANVDFLKSPHFKFSFELHKLMKNEDNNYYSISGKLHDLYYGSKKIEQDYEIR